MQAIILAATLSGDGYAQVIGRADDAVLFGYCRVERDGVQAIWSRVLSNDGSNRATMLTSWKIGHVHAPLTPVSLASILSGEPAPFVVPGDVFELDVKPHAERRSTVRMSQEDFEELMRGLLRC
jgi:hypothetical protein